MSYRIFLMFTQFNFGVHTVKGNMTSVILTGSYAVELFVIHLRELFSAGRVSPYPILKALFDKFLLCLCNCRFLFVENGFFLTVLIFDIVKDTDIFQVQRFLDYLVCVNTGSAVSAVRFHIGTVITFALNVPFAGILRVVYFDVPLCIAWSIEKFKHKLLKDFGRYPSCTEPYGYFACGQVFRLNFFQSLYIDFVIFGINLGRLFGCNKFFSDISRKVLICHQILLLGYISITIKRV